MLHAAPWHSVLLLSLMVLPFQGQSQKAFQGVVVYDIEYLYAPEGQEEVVKILPKQLVAYMAGKNLRYQQSTALSGEYTYIQPSGKDSVYHSIYLPNQRVLWSVSQPAQAPRYRLVMMNQSKTWSGFQLSKVRLQSANEKSLEAWVDQSYLNPFVALIPDLPYLPLVFETEQEGFGIRFTAVSSRQELLDPTYFELPDNAERISDAVFERLLN
jgi:hypothetical protein